MKNLFLLRGVPGAGKSTLARLMTETLAPFAFAASSDDFMVDENGDYKYDRSRCEEVHGKCETAIGKAMECETPFIFVHNTMTRTWEMQNYFQMAEQYGYRVFSLIVENRHGNPSVYEGVTEETYEKFKERFELKLK